MAEEALIETERMQIGFGLMKEAEAKRVISRWRRAAQGKAVQKMMSDISDDQLNAMGLGKSNAN